MGGRRLCPALGHSGQSRSPQFLREGGEGGRWARAHGQCPVSCASRAALPAASGTCPGLGTAPGGLLHWHCRNPGAGGSPASLPAARLRVSLLPPRLRAASARCEGRAAGRGAQGPPRLSPGTRLAPSQPGAVQGGERLPRRGAWLPAPHPLASFLASSGAARPGHRRACPHHVLTRARARLRGLASWHWHGDTESCGHPTAPRGAPGTQPCCPHPAALQPCRFLPGHLQPWHGHRLPEARDVGTLGARRWLSGQGWGGGSSAARPELESGDEAALR